MEKNLKLYKLIALLYIYLEVLVGFKYIEIIAINKEINTLNTKSALIL